MTDYSNPFSFLPNLAGGATPTGAMGNIFADILAAVLSNPEAMDGLEQVFNPGHTAVDVAQDALDAYEHGKLTKSQTMRIIEVCLEEQGKTVDAEARETLNRMFNQ